MHFLSDICAVDFPKRISRFEIIYNFTSIHYNSQMQIKTYIHELVSVQSISKIFSSANWFERELWDMFGIFFFEHYRLKRILTDYGFFGYPLRKEFPHFGNFEVKYSAKHQKVLYESNQFGSGRFLNKTC
jgi:NADH:ubiquinone oxidoreductase subunit C